MSTVHDAGTVLNQRLLDGQIHGALTHGLGGALFEELRYSQDGQPTSATFVDYLCPAAADADYQLLTAHTVTPSPVTALGAKGCGEGAAMSFPVAIANAVAEATAPAGIEITSLPLHGNVLQQLLDDSVNGDDR